MTARRSGPSTRSTSTRRPDEPEWLAVSTGLFGSRVSFVPLAEAQRDGDDIRVPYSKDQVKDSPNAEADGALSQDEESRLYRTTTWRATPGCRATTGRDVSGPETDDAMTRSEEELSVGKRQVETGRARLRKYVVTEEVTQTRPGPARGGPRRARADHGRQPRRRALRRRHHRGGARGDAARRGAGRGEADGAQGARAPRDRHRSPTSGRSPTRSARSASRPRATSGRSD